MRKTFKVAAVCACALLLAGCSDTPESLANQNVAKLEELRDVLKTVKDRATADAALPKVKAIKATMVDLRKRADALGITDLETAKKIREKHGERAVKVLREILDESTRIIFISPEIAVELKDALQSGKNTAF